MLGSMARASGIGFMAMAAALFAAGCGSATTQGDTGQTAVSPNASAGPAQEAEGHMQAANAAVMEGDAQTAFDEYAAAAEIFDHSGEVTIDRAEAHFFAAEQAYKLLDRDGAIAHYKAAIDIYLRFSGNSKAKAAVALNNLGAIYKERGDKNDAINAWEQALQVYKGLPEDLQNKAHMAKIQQNISDLKEGF